jgi:hypothetical protein
MPCLQVDTTTSSRSIWHRPPATIGVALPTEPISRLRALLVLLFKLYTMQIDL